MDIFEALQSYIKPELLVLVPLMFGLGAALKADKRFPSANIPYTLAVAGMALAALYGAATAQLNGWQSVAMAVFTAIVQGGLCALASVGVHQMYKQAKEKKHSRKARRQSGAGPGETHIPCARPCRFVRRIFCG